MEPNEQNNMQELAAKLAQCEKEKEELVNLSQRLKADFANYKKDEEKALRAFAKFAAKDILSRLLPVFDSFELAVRHVPKELESNNWAQGVKHTKQQIDAVLREVGVKEVPAEGAPFDPALHEAMDHVETDGEEGMVTEVLQKGYTLNGELLRAAKVTVSKKKQ